MKSSNAVAALLLVLTVSSASYAYIVPGDSHDNGQQQDNSRPPQYQPPRDDRNNHNGGDYGPGPGHGDHGGYGHPDHGGYGNGDHHDHGGYYPPTQPYYPPTQPYYPPTQPYYPPAVDPYYPSQPLPPPPPPSYPPSNSILAIPVYVGRSVANERLQLSQLADLNTQYPGWTIVAVTARTTPNSPATTLVRLAVDENVIATQTNPGYQINLYPTTTQTISGYSNIELWVNGSTYIESIEVQLQRY